MSYPDEPVTESDSVQACPTKLLPHYKALKESTLGTMMLSYAPTVP